MAAEKDLEQILRAYSIKKETGKISRYQLEKYAIHWAEEFKKNKPDFTVFSGWESQDFNEPVDELKEDGIIELGKDDNGSQVITYLRYYPYFVSSIYSEIEKDSEKPFPNEQFYGGEFPEAVVAPVDVRDHFVNVLRNIENKSGMLFRLNFPEGIRSLVVPSDLLLTKMLTLSLEKLRSYLSLQKNNEYAYNKLVSQFPKKENNLKDMFSNLMTQQSSALNTIRDPDDFTYQFWTNLSTMVVNEFREKENKLDREHSFCQSAYLIGMYVLFYKGKKKEKREKQVALKTVEEKVQNSPYYYTFTDIHGFKDKSGYPLTKKVSQDELSEFLENKTKQEPDSPLPSILRLRSLDKKSYYVAKERGLTLILQRCHAIGRELRKQYTEEWAKVLGEFKKNTLMNNRKSFQEDIWSRLEEQDPFLASILRFELIYVLLKETKPIKEVYYEAQRIINEKQGALIPIDEILRLDQKRLITDARTYLPLWKSIPVIGRLGVFLGRLFSSMGKASSNAKKKSSSSKSSNAKRSGAQSAGKAKGPSKKGGGFDRKGSAGSGISKGEGPPSPRDPREEEKKRKAEYRKAMKKLSAQYVEQGKSIDEALEGLIEEWNPLVDKQATDDLVEDVNSAIRDYIRKIRRKMVSPPDSERVQNLASQIAEYDAFSRIKKKKAFRKYIELYIIKLLGQ